MTAKHRFPIERSAVGLERAANRARLAGDTDRARELWTRAKFRRRIARTLDHLERVLGTFVREPASAPQPPFPSGFGAGRGGS